MPERYVCFQPECVDEFRCDGKSCQGHCCKYWQIAIDDSTWKRYSKMKLKSARKGILSHIKQKKDGRRYIKLSSNSACPFLQEDFLCRLQRDYGESYLSCICRTYPRIVTCIDGLMERALSLACPVAAKLVLLEKPPMVFEQIELLVDEPIQIREPLQSEGLKHLPELQYAGISLLQDRRFSLDQRLVMLGFFLEQAQELENMEHLEDLVRLYTSDAIAEHAPGMFEAIHFHREQYLKAMFDLLDVLYGEQSDLHIWDWQLDYVTKVFGFREDACEVPVDELMKAYEKFYPAAKKALMEKYGYVFENYLVNEFFGNVYPCRLEGSFTENFGVFLLGYKLLEFLMVAMAAECGDALQEDMVVGSIIGFAGKIDHSPRYLDCVAKEAMKWDGGVANVLRVLVQA